MVVIAMNCWCKIPDRLFLFCFFHIHHLISIGKNFSPSELLLQHPDRNLDRGWWVNSAGMAPTAPSSPW